MKALESFYHGISYIVNCYLGYLAPFLEKQLITISYNFEIMQPHKPRKMQNLRFFSSFEGFTVILSLRDFKIIRDRE